MFATPVTTRRTFRGSPQNPSLFKRDTKELIAEKFLPVCLELLKDEDPPVRQEAAKCIGEAGEDERVTKEHAEALAALSKDPKMEVRRSAVIALGRAGSVTVAPLPRGDRARARRERYGRTVTARREKVSPTGRTRSRTWPRPWPTWSRHRAGILSG